MATERIHIPIDKFGRVVLPKKLRDRLGVRPGTEFEVEETDDAILLKPLIPKAKVVDMGGWLVLAPSGGKKITNDDVNRIRAEIWRERTDRILNPK